MTLRLLEVWPVGLADYVVVFEAGDTRRTILVDRVTLGEFFGFRAAVHRACGIWATHECTSFNSPRQRREAWSDEISFAFYQTKQATG